MIMDQLKKLNTCLDSVCSVENYLLHRSSWFKALGYPSVFAITPLTAGSTNHIFRVKFQQPFTRNFSERGCKSIILKYAPEQVPLTPHISFNRERQQYEAAALRKLPGLIPSTSTTSLVRLPVLVHEDRDSNVLLMEDVCAEPELNPFNRGPTTTELSKFLKTAVADPKTLHLIDCISSALGSYLQILHSLDQSNFTQGKESVREAFASHADARKVCARTTYGEYLSSLESFGVELSSDQRTMIEEVMLSEEKKLLSSDETLVMGDFWVGNIILTLEEGDDSIGMEKLFSLHVIDWEFITYAPPHIDLAQFAAECWLFDHFNPSNLVCKRLTAGLFNSYRRVGGVIDMQRVIYYIAGHAGCFLGYSNWTKDVGQRKVTAALTLSMIEHASKKNWIALHNDSFLSGLLLD